MTEALQRIYQINQTIETRVFDRYNELQEQYFRLKRDIVNNPIEYRETQLETICRRTNRVLDAYQELLEEKQEIINTLDPSTLVPRGYRDIRRKQEDHVRLLEAYNREYNRMKEYTEEYPYMVVELADGGYSLQPIQLQNPSPPATVPVIQGFPHVIDLAAVPAQLTGPDREFPCFCGSAESIHDDTTNLCRINCPVGHIAHCSCIKKWINSRKQVGNTGGTEQEASVVFTVRSERARNDETIYNGWHNECPVCRGAVTQIADVVLPGDGNETEFGKTKMAKTLKMVNKDISYLKNRV